MVRGKAQWRKGKDTVNDGGRHGEGFGKGTVIFGEGGHVMTEPTWQEVGSKKVGSRRCDGSSGGGGVAVVWQASGKQVAQRWLGAARAARARKEVQRVLEE